MIKIIFSFQNFTERSFQVSYISVPSYIISLKWTKKFWIMNHFALAALLAVLIVLLQCNSWNCEWNYSKRRAVPFKSKTLFILQPNIITPFKTFLKCSNLLHESIVDAGSHMQCEGGGSCDLFCFIICNHCYSNLLMSCKLSDMVSFQSPSCKCYGIILFLLFATLFLSPDQSATNPSSPSSSYQPSHRVNNHHPNHHNHLHHAPSRSSGAEPFRVPVGMPVVMELSTEDLSSVGHNLSSNHQRNSPQTWSTQGQDPIPSSYNDLDLGHGAGLHFSNHHQHLHNNSSRSKSGIGMVRPGYAYAYNSKYTGLSSHKLNVRGLYMIQSPWFYPAFMVSIWVLVCRSRPFSP